MKLSIPDEELETYSGFLDESGDHLESMEQKVLALAESGDADLVNQIFRALHSIKGVASFLGLSDIQRLSHSLESVFDRVRQGTLILDPELTRIALDNLDRLQAMLAALGEGLKGRSRVAGQGWDVSVETVEYAGSLRDLERAVSGGRASPAGEEPGLTITPEMTAAFVKEGEEALDVLEQRLLRLSENPGDADALAEAFRSIHSFKGNAGLLGFPEIEDVSHRLESILQPLRDARAEVPAAVIKATLDSLDSLRKAVAGIAAGGNPSVPGYGELRGRLAALAGAGPEADRAPRLGEILVAEGSASEEDIDRALELQQRPLGRILVEEGLADPAAVEAALNRQGKPGMAASGAAQASAAGKDGRKDLRVDVAKLDLLLDLVGELVISTGMLFNPRPDRDGGARAQEKARHHLLGVVGELQSVALGMRMIPIDGTFRKMNRLVHDLSAKSGKKLRLDIRGGETEIDKNVADRIADPLVHMIRNSADHGLEAPEERLAAGKDACGTITLEAAQEGGEILITVRDDGRGMDRDRILRKAAEKGLLEGDGAALSDEDAFQFIFMPGFSTAQAVSSTSGRGVGMDVVKSNVESIGGRVSVRSRRGEGSAITLRIPLTLSIIDGMMVRVGGSLFTLPLAAVKESLSPKGRNLSRLSGGQEVLLLRGKVLPVIRLHRLHSLDAGAESLEDGLLICLESRDGAYCLFVDELIGQRQTVVKALPGYFGKVKGISSCSILDSGDISLILDVPGMYEKHLQSEGA